MMSDESPLGGQLQAALSTHLHGFEARDGQRQMIAAIDTAMRDGHDLVVEAGTGTGKTLAYLLPILAMGRRAIIATATKQLQNQVLNHDLPVALAATGVQVDATALKGRANYICLLRLQQARAEAGVIPGRELLAIEEATLRSSTGDVSDVSDVDQVSAIWPSVTSTADNCLGGECTHYEDCFVVRARRRALTADVVIVNHHVLLADYALRERWDGATLLGDTDVIVIDEAHALADVASNFFGVSVSSRRAATLCKELANVAAAKGGHEGAAIGGAADSIRQAAGALWAAAAGEASQEPLDGAWLARLIEPRDDLLDVLRDQWRLLGAPALLSGSPAVQKVRETIEQLEHDLCAVIDRSDDDSTTVRWLERRSRSCVLHARPIECGPILQRTLLAEMAVRIFTSATLAIGDDFGPFVDAVGLDEQTPRLRLDGGYDFEQQALLYLPRHIAEPWADGRERSVAIEIKRLCIASGGAALALFTSRRGMHDAYRRLQSKLPMVCLLQGTASKNVLLERFVNEQPAVLFATMGFWQGVDLPGDALQLVIVDKVPFPPPGDPLFAARSKRLERAGKSSFASLSIPAAAILLRQGFGRLIRGSNDRGVVAILDPRLTRRGYGKRLLRALPAAPKTVSFGDVEDFFGVHQQTPLGI